MSEESGLIPSVRDFLVESIRNHSGGKLNFAILHAVSATELVLKERLRRIHPSLIYKDVDSKPFPPTETVGLGALPQRLSNFGVTIDSNASKLIKQTARWRNQIVHHMPDFDRVQARHQLPQLLNFIATFLREELETPVETVLPLALFKVADGLITDWQRVVSEAQKTATSEGNVIEAPCHSCGAEAVLVMLPEERAYCHLCKHHFYLLTRCAGCGLTTTTTYATYPEYENFCDACVDAAGDYWLSLQVDIARGK